MYDLPSQPNVRECIINEEVVSSKTDPILLYESGEGEGEGEENEEKAKKISSAP